MKTSLLSPPAAQSSEALADLVAEYAVADELPSTEWLTRLRLERPRRDLRSLDGWTRGAKRVVDVIGACGLLLVLSPLLVVVALLIRLTAPGPIIYRQVRVGLNLRRGPRRNRGNTQSPPADNENRRRRSDRRCERAYGRHFVLYKFRTMRLDAERGGAQFAKKGDPRVTRLGRFLRKSRIDELPQLWNVLRGEMSLVGPRPERPEFIEQLSGDIPGYLFRLGLKPGLTGVAQVVNGYDNDLAGFRRKVAYDLLYLQNCCLRNDLKILLRTVGVVLTGRGAL